MVSQDSCVSEPFKNFHDVCCRVFNKLGPECLRYISFYIVLCVLLFIMVPKVYITISKKRLLYITFTCKICGIPFRLIKKYYHRNVTKCKPDTSSNVENK